ncbi:MAG: hypothetical protein ACRDRJ_49980 [Streptosporangiaceae bacterium]
MHTTDYGMREGSHTDPDGNVIRFGSETASEAQPGSSVVLPPFHWAEPASHLV